MQVLQSTYKIDEYTSKDALLLVVSDKYCRSILEAIMDKPKSVAEINAETSMVYSKNNTNFLFDFCRNLTSLDSIHDALHCMSEKQL